MSERRRKVIVSSIFVVALVWGICNQPWKHLGTSGSPQSGGGGSDTTASPQAAQATVAPVGKRAQESELASDWTVDPFRSRTITATPVAPAVAAEQQPVPALQGIMLVGNEPVCVIGGQILKKGDRFGEWRVDVVAMDQVEITRLSDRRHLTLRAGEGAGNKRR
jgi:hypothetical protein